MSAATSTRTFRSQFGHWAAELQLVFLGAYAAFWLTDFQQHQEDARRRVQILESLEQNTRETATSSEGEAVKHLAKAESELLQQPGAERKRPW